MTIKELQNKCIAMYRTTLNINSKWYKSDLADYTAKILANSNKTNLTEKLNRLNAMTSKQFEKSCCDYSNKIKQCFLAAND
ncbi:hypothetical protein MEO40_17760 [Dolichospermum sp. ST_sed1]|nr:hypothetical protein [Dolichospermum sp. ST_sed1]